MVIPEEKIAEIQERIDLVALVSRHVELKKSGRSFKGRCPFHQENTPSFYVTPEIKRFKCFGCQASGDAISFLQRYLGKTFVDAVRELAREAGVDLQAAEDPSFEERRRLREVTDFAAQHFRARFEEADRGKGARDYLAERGISVETTQAFGLGWSLAAWTDLADRLRQAGMLDWGVKAGLVQPRTHADGFYDLFRGRVIIPIRSTDGRTIAFGGRLLEGDQGPKYLNSRESRLYNKSEVLFGLSEAKDEVHRRHVAVLVEGYFDCIALHQAGFRHAVALCSTALTPGHLSALSRCDAKSLVLLLDGDEAGRSAVTRLAPLLLQSGFATRVALLPSGEDPDTFVRKSGADALNDLLNQAANLTEYLFATVLPEGRAGPFEAKMQALTTLKPLVAPMPIGLQRSAFIGAMASHFGLPAIELEAALRGKSPVAKLLPRPAEVAPRPRGPSTPDSLEAAFAAAVLRNRELLAFDTFGALDEIRHADIRAIVNQAALGVAFDDVLTEVAESTRREVEKAAAQLPVTAPELEQLFSALCRKVKLQGINAELRQMTRALQQVEGASDLSDEARRLLEERVELLKMRAQIQGGGNNFPSQPSGSALN